MSDMHDEAKRSHRRWKPPSCNNRDTEIALPAPSSSASSVMHSDVIDVQPVKVEKQDEPVTIKRDRAADLKSFGRLVSRNQLSRHNSLHSRAR